MTQDRPSPGRACPNLDTERLTLRAHASEDYDDVLAMWRDPVVTRFFGGLPATAEEGWHRLVRYAGFWAIVGYGFWSVRETATGKFVGDVGLAEFRREIRPSIIGVPEAGWVLCPWAHGKGYAREACEAMFAWADRALPGRRTVCMIDPDNTASLGLAARLGFETFATTSYKGADRTLLERAARLAFDPAAR